MSGVLEGCSLNAISREDNDRRIQSTSVGAPRQLRSEELHHPSAHAPA